MAAGQNFSAHFVFLFNNVTGLYEWEAVTSTYNEEKPDRAPQRDIEAIRNKFRTLKNVKKPTGDPTCPPLVARAKRINYDIEARNGVIDFDDNTKQRNAFSLDSDSDSSDNISSDSEDDSSGHASVISSPIQQRSNLSDVIPETAVPIVVEDSFLPHSASQLIQDEQDQVFSSEEDSDRINIANSSVAAGAEGKKRTSKVSQVPHRLGADSQKLGNIMENLLDKKRGTDKSKKRKKDVPENPTHTKKRTIAKELQDIDAEFECVQDRYERNLELQRQSMEFRHQEEMRRLDQQNAIQERRFEIDGQRHQAFMMLMISALSGNRQLLSNSAALGVGPLSDNNQHNL